MESSYPVFLSFTFIYLFKCSSWHEKKKKKQQLWRYWDNKENIKSFLYLYSSKILTAVTSVNLVGVGQWKMILFLTGL